ncbi:hypothetical protein [Lysinibacillus fusiformis]|uniref:Uncharacterized protein n=1 Tax=Lysinibacillus fusiformis TaxID=28031 RepID=A0A1H9H9X0_9BACI|nr:hypothetical protein [Lysinibacillus fusiformis]SCY30095.1 hypothetical protein SAMN02787081_01948 [Lysinibacillus fusiformis]SEN53804.1 hypothetical protein SAMN02787103_02073 [Lysinibacillus fusiformis]SEQ59141.1 hypothetical protein SAMN02787113_01961 [Lysinibacillus fusiformis]
MSASKDYYASTGWSERVKQMHPILKVGFKFTVERATLKVDNGTWEIVDNKGVPYYKCRRLLRNGTFATWSTRNERLLSERLIYENLNQKTPSTD